MRQNRTTDLLTEVNTMRGMMGLKPKGMLMENLAITLLRAFAKTATKYAAKTAAEIGSELGAAARATKNMFDDLDAAIKIGDEMAAKAMITNIVNTLDNNALRLVANDVLADTADDALRSVITKRTQALKAMGGADDAIKTQIKQDLDILLADAPDVLRTAIKDASDDIVKNAITGTARVTTNVVTSQGVLAKLSQSRNWAQLMDQFPELRIKFIKRIDNIIAAGAKSEDEVFAVIEGQVANKLKYKQFWAKVEAFKSTNPNTYKILIWTLGLGAGGAIAGGAGILPKISAWVCEKLIGDNDEWCVSAFSSAYEEGGDTETTTPTGACDKTESDFVAWAESQFGTGGDPSFDSSTCTGTVYGDQYKWNGTDWV